MSTCVVLWQVSLAVALCSVYVRALTGFECKGKLSQPEGEYLHEPSMSLCFDLTHVLCRVSFLFLSALPQSQNVGNVFSLRGVYSSTARVSHFKET